MRVVLTREAREDLERIGDFIALDNPARARAFVQELVEAAQGLSHAPERFQLVPRYAHLDVRRRVHGAYLIFYRVEAERVAVLHVRHGAQDYETLLFLDV